jgi:hypothetical protein
MATVICNPFVVIIQVYGPAEGPASVQCYFTLAAELIRILMQSAEHSAVHSSSALTLTGYQWFLQEISSTVKDVSP